MRRRQDRSGYVSTPLDRLVSSCDIVANSTTNFIPKFEYKPSLSFGKSLQRDVDVEPFLS